MAMQAESLEVLERASVPPLQARAIVRAIEIEIDGARDTLATKHDILLLRQEMAEMRHSLESRIEAVRTGSESQSEAVRTGSESKIDAVRTDLELKLEGLRTSLESKIESLRADFHKAGKESAWRLYGALVAQMTVLLGITYFFVTHAMH